MAKKASRSPTQFTIATDQPAHRTFKDRPSGVYIDGFTEHVRATAQPETYPGLYWGKIPRDAQFRRLRKFSVDRMKRPARDMAFCPRCDQADKFIHGDLAWFPELQICAAIGNCCASHEALAEAEREYKWREKVAYEESYLLAGLPLVAEKLAVLAELRSDCREVVRVYRQFRVQGQALHAALRRLKEQHGGHLIVTTVLSGTTEDEAGGRHYMGPAGFRGKGRHNVETRDTDLGLMSGLIALHRNFDPEKERVEIERQLLSLGTMPDGEAVLDFIIGMSARERTAAVAILQTADRKFQRLVQRVDEFWSFFTPANLATIRRYVEHPDSVVFADIKRQTKGGKTVVRFENRNFLCRLEYQEPRVLGNVIWPVADTAKDV